MEICNYCSVAAIGSFLIGDCFIFSEPYLGDAILQGCPKLEIYNSCFTCNFGDWALGYCGDVYGKDNPSSLNYSDHPLQNVTSLDLSDRSIDNLVNKVCEFSSYSVFCSFGSK